MNSIMTRRSTRKYLDKAVEPEKIESLFRAAMQAPTGHNVQDWEFIVVTDAAMRKAVSRMGPWSEFSADAPLQIVVCANLEKAWPGGTWPSNMAAACQNILLQAEEEGLGACWMAGWPYEEHMVSLRESLGIPETVVPYGVIALGYKQFEKRPADRFDPEKIHWEKY